MTKTRAYFFACFDRNTCCRIPGVHGMHAETLTDAIQQLPPNWTPWEAHLEHGNQLLRATNEQLRGACEAAGKYRHLVR